jgi:hypothetical protein
LQEALDARNKDLKGLLEDLATLFGKEALLTKIDEAINLSK